MEPRTAIYPGSFDPPTLGHIDIIERAAALFDRVLVAVGRNPHKIGFLDIEERVEALEACTKSIPGVSVAAFDGLLIDFAQRIGARCIVRGLRATADFDYEFQIAMANRRLAPQIETVFLMTKWEHSFLSSSVVREVAQLGGDYRGFVPEEIIPIVEKRLRSGGGTLARGEVAGGQ